MEGAMCMTDTYFQAGDHGPSGPPAGARQDTGTGTGADFANTGGAFGLPFTTMPMGSGNLDGSTGAQVPNGTQVAQSGTGANNDTGFNGDNTVPRPFYTIDDPNAPFQGVWRSHHTPVSLNGSTIGHSWYGLEYGLEPRGNNNGGPNNYRPAPQSFNGSQAHHDGGHNDGPDFDNDVPSPQIDPFSSATSSWAGSPFDFDADGGNSMLDSNTEYHSAHGAGFDADPSASGFIDPGTSDAVSVGGAGQQGTGNAQSPDAHSITGTGDVGYNMESMGGAGNYGFNDGTGHDPLLHSGDYNNMGGIEDSSVERAGIYNHMSGAGNDAITQPGYYSDTGGIGHGSMQRPGGYNPILFPQASHFGTAPVMSSEQGMLLHLFYCVLMLIQCYQASRETTLMPCLRSRIRWPMPTALSTWAITSHQQTTL